MYDIINCSFFEKADKEGHLVVTLPPHYHHMATTGARGSLYARTLSQHLVAIFLRLSRQRGNTSLFERRVAGHLRFKGRGRGGKGRGANGCRRRLSAATTQVDEPGLRKIGALRSPHPSQADLPHAHLGVRCGGVPRERPQSSVHHASCRLRGHTRRRFRRPLAPTQAEGSTYSRKQLVGLAPRLGPRVQAGPPMPSKSCDVRQFLFLEVVVAASGWASLLATAAPSTWPRNSRATCWSCSC